MSIIAESPGYLQVFSDGSVKRSSPEISPASSQFSNGYKSKDVVVDPSKPILARLFVPDTGDESTILLPLLLYFHGGGFCIGSTTWRGYHEFLGGLCVRAKVVVLSVDYRLAPENRLPAAYDDCYSLLDWLHREGGSETWLRQADMSRVFLSGDSAGANICHNVAFRATEDGIGCPKIKGLLAIHPYFGSERRIESEIAAGANDQGVAMNDMFWRLSLPEGSSRDHHACNFEKAELPEGRTWAEFPAALVFVAGLDLLKERGVLYAKFLKAKGVKEVEIVEAEGEQHVYHAFFPHSEATHLLQNQMGEFIARF